MNDDSSCDLYFCVSALVISSRCDTEVILQEDFGLMGPFVFHVS